MTESASNIRLQVIRNLNEFRSVAGAWNTLLGQSAERCPTSAHSWIVAWWEAFGANAHFIAVLLWDGPSLRCALPLRMLRDSASGREVCRATTLSNSWVDRTGILVRAGDALALDSLADVLASDRFDAGALELKQRASDSVIAAPFLSALRARGVLVGLREGLRSPFVELPKTWEELESTLSPAFRQSLRRRWRAVERMDGIEMRIYRDASVIGPIMAVSLESWQHDGRTSMASSHAIRRFYEQVILGAEKDGTLYSSVLFRHAMPVAFEFNLRHGSTLHNFKLGYRKDAADWSPGQVLKAFTLRTFIEEHCQGPTAGEYDLMGTDEPYKLNWTKSVRTHDSVLVLRPTLANRLRFAGEFGLKPFVRDRLPRLTALGKQFVAMTRRRGAAR